MKGKNMLNELKSCGLRKGFTLIELMVVVLIIAVLAAILIPYMTARIEAARWSEGKAGCGTLATAIRARYAEMGEDFDNSTTPGDYLTASDLRGKYFSIGDYLITIGAASGDYAITYTVSVLPPADATVTASWTKPGYTLDHTGKWSEYAAAP